MADVVRKGAISETDGGGAGEFHALRVVQDVPDNKNVDVKSRYEGVKDQPRTLPAAAVRLDGVIRNDEKDPISPH